MRALLCCGCLAVLLLGFSSPRNPAVGSADSSDSGVVSKSYVREVRYLDADRNGEIDTEELVAGQQMASVLLMLSWEECDRNGDGAVSVSEFASAAAEMRQTLLKAEGESDSAAEEAVARALSLRVLLDRLATEEQYAAELAELREAVEDLDDDEAVATHIVRNPALYPRLTPVVGTYIRHYPVRPPLRRLVPHYAVPFRHHPKAVKPLKGPKPPKPAVKPAKKPKAVKKAPAPRPRGRSGGRRRP